MHSNVAKRVLWYEHKFCAYTNARIGYVLQTVFSQILSVTSLSNNQQINRWKVKKKKATHKLQDKASFSMPMLIKNKTQ